MVFEVGPDPLLTCPYDESHRILKSRMQFHMVKCENNNKMGMKMRCPWNPLHIIDKFAYEDHYKRDCEDMPQAVASMCATEESRDVGSVPVNATNAVLPPADEDWDAEPGPVGTYDPTKNAEGRQVLRIAVGLSKAKKKQYRQAERRRFQELQEKEPIQMVAGRSEETIKSTKELRAPFTVSKNLSANTSMLEDLNSTKLSENDRNGWRNANTPLVRELRPPHEPSLTLSCKADPPSTTNGAVRKSSTSENGARALDEVPNLCQSLNNTFIDIMSMRSSTSTYDLNEIRARTSRENNMRIPNLNDSLACFSEADKSVRYLDEAACVPNLVGPVAEQQDDLDVSQHFAGLEAVRKENDATIAYAKKHIEMYELELPKLVSSLDALNLPQKPHDDGNADDDQSPTKQQSHLLNGLRKCAANFSKHTKNTPPPKVGVGRGIVIAFDSFKENRPGPTPEEINAGINSIGRSPRRSTNPFEISAEEFAANVSRQTYTLSTANENENYSDYGYEKAD